MKNIRSLVVLALSCASLLAQTVDDPILVGNTGTLLWDNNPASEGVFQYHVYRIQAGATNRVRTVTTNSTPISGVLPAANGDYALFVTAVNPAGESAPSATIWVRYWFNKPTPPKGLTAQ